MEIQHNNKNKMVLGELIYEHTVGMTGQQGIKWRRRRVTALSFKVIMYDNEYGYWIFFAAIPCLT